MNVTKIFLENTLENLYLHRHQDTASPAGGIGRRVGLKHQYLRMCRFDSGAGYLTRKASNNSLAFLRLKPF